MKAEKISEVYNKQQKRDLPLALVARKLEHAVSRFFLNFFVAALNLSPCFQCVLFTSLLLSDESQRRETPWRMFSRCFWNQSSHREDQNPTSNPDPAHTWGLGHQDNFSMHLLSNVSNMSALQVNMDRETYSCTHNTSCRWDQPPLPTNHHWSESCHWETTFVWMAQHLVKCRSRPRGGYRSQGYVMLAAIRSHRKEERLMHDPPSWTRDNTARTWCSQHKPPWKGAGGIQVSMSEVH